MQPGPKQALPESSSEPAGTRRKGGLAAMCWAYAVAAVAFWVVIRYAADRWWPATLLLFAPRWPWLLPLLLLLPLTLRKRRRLVWLPLLTMLFVLGPLLGFNIPWQRAAAPKAEGLKIRVLSCNVHRTELDLPRLEAFVQAVQPDIVALQDYSGWDDSPLLAHSQWHTYRFGEIFLASKFPIVRVRDLELEEIGGEDLMEAPHRTGAGGCFDLQTPAGILHLLDVHLASPHPAMNTLVQDPELGSMLLRTNSVRRWRESQRIRDFLAADTGPFIVAGDFNTPVESPIYRHFYRDFSDAFGTTAFGYGYTHYTAVSDLRLDHLLGGRGVRWTSCRIGPPIGTPHRPIVADAVIVPADQAIIHR